VVAAAYGGDPEARPSRCACWEKLRTINGGRRRPRPRQVGGGNIREERDRGRDSRAIGLDPAGGGIQCGGVEDLRCQPPPSRDPGRLRPAGTDLMRAYGTVPDPRPRGGGGSVHGSSGVARETTARLAEGSWGGRPAMVPTRGGVALPHQSLSRHRHRPATTPARPGQPGHQTGGERPSTTRYAGFQPLEADGSGWRGHWPATGPRGSILRPPTRRRRRPS